MTTKIQARTAAGDGATGAADTQAKRGLYGKPGRVKRLGQVLPFGSARARGVTETASAQRLGAARTTLRSATAAHVARCQNDADLFFESPAGLAFLQRMGTALHVVLTLSNPCGVEQVSQVLRLSGLDRWLAASQGAQHRHNVALRAAVRAFAQEQTARLGTAMPPKRVPVHGFLRHF